MLYFIPTPIWNTKDITLRALDLFKQLKYFISEDTRTTKKLLWIYEIDFSWKQFFSLTSFTQQYKLDQYLDILKNNDVGLVSDAWTPWFSDPWKILIKLCNQYWFEYTIFPWANALIPVIVWSAFDTSNFIFLWFLPTKKGRNKIFNQILNFDSPVFFYESVHRIKKTLSELKSIWFKWSVCIAREISKMFEQYVNWNIDEILEKINNKKIPIKWEFVVGLKN